MYAVVNTENTISEPLSLRLLPQSKEGAVLLRTERRRIGSVVKKNHIKLDDDNFFRKPSCHGRTT